MINLLYILTLCYLYLKGLMLVCRCKTGKTKCLNANKNTKHQEDLHVASQSKGAET